MITAFTPNLRQDLRIFYAKYLENKNKYLPLWRKKYTSMVKEQKYCYKYPHPAVAADCVMFGFDGVGLQVLLIERGAEPYKGRWAFPGGFINMNEDAEDGAKRELKEETGFTAARIEQFYTFSNPNRDPRERVISIAYYALVQIQEVKGGDDAARAKWFGINEVPQLAFDHDLILRKAITCLRESIHFQPVGFELLPEKFTIRELQSLYEAILGVCFDRRNFLKKMLRLELLEQTDETIWPTPKRKAILYRFNSVKYTELKQKGYRLEF